MNKKYRSLLVIISLMLIFQSVFVGINYSFLSYAADNELSILITGYFEYWRDPTSKQWLYDDSNNIRHSFPKPENFIYNYNYNINIPSGYKLKRAVPFQNENAHPNLKNWTQQAYSHINQYKVHNMTIDNADSLIGETKVAHAKVTFYIPHEEDAWVFERPERPGVPVYRHYMPIVLELEPLKNPDKVIIKYQDTNGKTLKPDDEAMELSKEGYNDVYPNETKHADLLAQGYTLNTPKTGYYSVYNSNKGNIHTVIFKYNPPLDVYITVTGVADPNPVILSNRSGITQITVKGEVFNLRNGISVQSMKLFIQSNVNNQWLEQNFISSNLKQEHNFGEFTIKSTTLFPIKAEARLSDGKVISATGQLIVYVEEPQTTPSDWEITADPRLYSEPLIIELSKKEFDANKGTEILVELEAREVFATHGVDKYNHLIIKERASYNTPGGSVRSDWIKDETFKSNLIVYPSDISYDNVAEIEGRLGVQDNKGNIRYFWADNKRVSFNIILQPPETELQLPSIFYPKEVTNFNKNIKNIISWSYYSDDDIPYSHSIVSLYKLDAGETPVFENNVQTERELVIEGNKDEEYKIVVKVVDQEGQESQPKEEEFIIVNAAPKIKVELDTSKEDENLLGIQVENITPIEIESIFPTSYTAWEILNKEGNVMQSGPGKAPAWVEIDENYQGTVSTVIQYAENILQNKAYDKAYYMNNSILDFLIDPDRLFETELAQIIKFTRALENEEWTITRQSPINYETLILDDNLQFTREKGKYIVKLEANGKIGSERKMFAYSNKRSDLRKEPPVLNDSIIKNTFGTNSFFVNKSEKWISDKIETGNFTFNGSNYNYRREYMIVTLDTLKMSKTRPVEFLNAEPNAEFNIISDLGLFLGIDTNNSKEYKKIIVDGRASIDATDQELQEKYPILFNHPKTQIKIVPIKGIGGEVDADINTSIINNLLIKGYGSNVVDTVEGKRFIMEGSEAYPADLRHFRIDLSGNYRISYKVYNGLKESKWVTKDIIVYPELLPSLDIKVTPQPTAYRDPENNLKTEITVIADYNINPFEEPLDTIHPDDVIFYIHYDENGNFGSEIESTQWIKRDSHSIADYITIKEKIFGENQAKIVLLIDNEEKNLFGHFKFEVEVKETPTIPNYEEPPTIPLVDIVKINTGPIDDEKKRTFIDNRKPVITLNTKRKQTVEITIIDTTNGEMPIDVQEIMDQLKLHDIQVEINVI